MCGIAGIIGRERSYVAEPASLRAMMDAIAHRGPDDEGSWTAGSVALGHKRLSIIDVATGHQPMANEDETIWIVFNGEIYNYLELRRDLVRGHTFRTQSDTEVILHLYEELGERCLDRLNGMFAFAIWDTRQHKLFAARDRLGIKPFYWHQNKDRLVFASEPKALIRGAGVPATPDSEGLEEYLTFQFCLGDRTLFQKIRSLEPGCYLTYRPGREREPSIVQYWDFNYEIDTHHTSEYYVDHLLMLLQDSVRLQLRSDVPVGAHLSGGIDSSTVVCMAAQAYGGRLHTFTGGFRDGPQYDETAYARIVATRTGSDHHEVWPTAQELADQLPGLIYMMDEPAAGPGLFPQYAVSRLARQHVKVVLGGQGGDEMFGGYARYLVAYLEQVIKGTIFGTQEEGRHVVTWEGIAPNLPLLRQYRPLMQSYFRDGLFDDMDRRYFRLVSRLEDVDTLISGDAWKPDSATRMFEAFSRVFNNRATKSYFNKMTNFDLKTLLPALLHVEDRTSMAVSLESRVPLLDHRIAELVTRMPPATRFLGGDTKRVFREAVRDVLPPEIFNRRDKMGFPVPLVEWARGPLRDFVADTLLSRRAAQRGLYKMDGVRAVIDGDRGFGRQLWGLLCLELWFRAFVDGDGQPLPRKA
jgi:asparagine synthase (glutamine-hydrolysing)